LTSIGNLYIQVEQQSHALTLSINTEIDPEEKEEATTLEQQQEEAEARTEEESCTEEEREWYHIYQDACRTLMCITGRRNNIDYIPRR